MDVERGEVTLLLDALRNRQGEAESRLLALVYGKLRRLARSHLRNERPDHTWQPTDLVHEVYIRMTGAEIDWRDRAHFFAIAAQAMRRILVDHARSRGAIKRSEGGRKVALEEGTAITAAEYGHVIEVNEALDRLAQLDARQARVVELRYFADLSIDEVAEVLNCSDRTVKRDWRLAKAWLRRELSRSAHV
jgi:RNA polymerase sigma factor (TIGR02999 family)